MVSIALLVFGGLAVFFITFFTLIFFWVLVLKPEQGKGRIVFLDFKPLLDGEERFDAGCAHKDIQTNQWRFGTNNKNYDIIKQKVGMFRLQDRKLLKDDSIVILDTVSDKTLVINGASYISKQSQYQLQQLRLTIEQLESENSVLREKLLYSAQGIDMDYERHNQQLSQVIKSVFPFGIQYPQKKEGTTKYGTRY